MSGAQKEARTAAASLPHGDLLVVIPARNEARSIGTVIDGIRAVAPGAEVLVVEDGSRDETVAVAEQHGARVVSLPISLGYGGALRIGFGYALSKGFRCVVSMDADGQHDPNDLLTLRRRIDDDQLDLVVGSRFLGGVDYPIPLTRRLGMTLFSVITSAVVGSKIGDTTCGYMIVGPRALPIVARHCATDFPNAELICLVSRSGLRVGEAPVTIHERGDGSSMFTFWRSVYYPFKLLLAVSMVLLRRED